MFDSIRRHQRLALIFLALLIIPSFVLFGVHGWQQFAHDATTVATVGDQKISRQEYDSVVRDQVERMRQMFGGSIDASQINTPALRKSVLDSLIQQRVLAEETQRKYLTASDEQVREAILAIPAVQQLRKADGSIDLKAYEQLLVAQGLTPERFDAQIRFELASRQLPANVLGSALLPKSVAERFIALRAQEREVQELLIPASDYAPKINPSADQLKAYYEQHKQAFQTPERAHIEYVVLDPKAVPADTATPSDDALKKLYNDNIARYKTDEQRRVSHILIAAPQDATPAERAKAKAKAEEILAQVRKQPDSFAKLAEENSQDPGSAAKGGDLGYFGRGAMVKPFEDAAFKLKENEISDIVQTDFGYHILKLTGIKPAETKPFEQVKGELATEYQQQQQAKKYAQLADQFTNMVYEQSDSLKPVADKLHLKIETADVGRMPNPALGKDSLLNNEKLLRAIFGEDALKNKRNTEAVDVGQGVLVSAHVIDYQPAAVPALGKIEAQVRQKVVAEQAAEQARKAGEARLADLRKRGSADGFAAVQTVSRDNPGKLAPKALTAIFGADAGKLPAYVGVDLSGSGYAIYRIVKVGQPASVDAARSTAETQQLEQIAAQAELGAYLKVLRDRSKVKVQDNELKNVSEQAGS